MKRKLIRITTADISLNSLLRGQLRFLNQEFEVVALAANTGVLEDVGIREGIRVINVPMHREISLISDFKCLIELIKIFKKERPYIVHSNTPKSSLLSMIAAKISGVPHRIYTVTGLRYQGYTGRVRLLLMTMERIACAFATKVIPEGQGVRKTLIDDHITRKQLKVIHNGNINGIDSYHFSKEGCPVTRESIRAKIGLDDDDFAFIFIGRIVRDKGMNELADAIRNLSIIHHNMKLILVGSFESGLDPLDPANVDFFNSSPLVIYVGRQPDVRPYLLAADALVFPSYREGFPNVVLQAGAMGLPAIVTNINGCNEIIKEGENGVIIPPRDQGALEEAMALFLDNRDVVINMSRCSREMIVSRYEQREFWDALMSMYEHL